MKIEIDHELFLFALLGIICGVFAAVFVQLMTKIIYARHKMNNPYISDNLKWCLAVALISGVMKYPVQFMMISDYKILNHMFLLGDIDSNTGMYLID